MEDLQRLTGFSVPRIARALRSLLEAGKLEQGRHIIINRLGDGVPIKVFGYRLKGGVDIVQNKTHQVGES